MGVQLLAAGLCCFGLCCFGLGVYVGAIITHTSSERMLREYERVLRVIVSRCSDLKDDKHAL